MSKHLLMVFIVCALLASGLSELQAQSSSRGSSSNSSASAAMKRQEREQKAEISKAAKNILKHEFVGIKLDKDQRDKLHELTGENLQQLNSFDTQIGGMIPAKDLKKLQRFYNVSKKKGLDEKESMLVSMIEIGLPEDTQTKILELSASKMVVVDQIVAGVAETFTDEQKATFAEKASTKDESLEEMEGKETMETKEPAGSATKDTETKGSTRQGPVGPMTTGPKTVGSSSK